MTDNEWISIEDRLPELGETVLSFGNDKTARQTKYTSYREGSIGHYEGRKERWFEYVDNDYCMRHSGVTHWMHLSNPPKTLK